MLRSLVACTLLAVPGFACLGDEPAKPASPAKTEKATMTSPLDLKTTDIAGKDTDLSQYKGKVVLIVNVASKCGYTPQYKELQTLYTKYKDQGLVVLGVPANNFGAQEPGSNDDIVKFCTTNYNVTFPMLAKQSVKGDDISPLYRTLTEKATNPASPGDVGWNFEKCLIGRDGQIAHRYKSGEEPMGTTIVADLEKALAAKAK